MSDYIQRDMSAERRLLDVAASAAGFLPQTDPMTRRVVRRHPVPVTLEQEGAQRANLGPNGEPHDLIWMPPGRDLLLEGKAEIVDGGAHYFLWEAVRCEPGLRTGDHTMIDRYDRSMRVLTRLLQGWSEYHRSSA